MTKKHEKYQRLIDVCQPIAPTPTAVAHPCDASSLEGAMEAARLGLIVPILVGPRERILAVAAASGIDLSGAQIVDAPHSEAAAAAAVQLVREGKAEALMKGSLHTDELMAAVVKRDTGLRTARRVSHCFVMDVPGHEQALIITDAAVNIAPTLEAKADILQNAIDLAHAMGQSEVRVGILSAMETVNPKVPSTIEAAALCKMVDRGQITGAQVDGPLALDNAINLEAAQIKKIDSPVAGRANILLVPDLESGNMLAKSLSFLAGADAAGIVLGAKVPIILTSRADSVMTRLASCAVAVLVAKARRESTKAVGSGMADVILVINAGSSSLKFSAFDVGSDKLSLMLSGQIEGLYTAPHFIARDAQGAELGSNSWAEGTELGHGGAIAHLVDFLQGSSAAHKLIAVGHRVVHGGLAFTQAVRIDPEVVAALEKLSPLAPLHQPHNLKPIGIVAKLRPELPQVACFDTAFHRAQPEVAQAFALPSSITGLGVRRYGFHGLSYEYIASVLQQFDPKAAAGRTVVAHLGNGSSMCAMTDGRSMASTMGFTAVDGLPMGTRCGNLDPGVILYLMDELGMDARAIEDLIYKRSGLLGVSGLSSDMRTLLASDDERARFAVDLYTYRLGRELGSLAAAAGGIDALVFTAGIGEHAPVIRERVCHDAAWLGVALDPARNDAGGPRISTPDSKISVWVIPTNEELIIARQTLKIARGVPA